MSDRQYRVDHFHDHQEAPSTLAQVAPPGTTPGGPAPAAPPPPPPPSNQSMLELLGKNSCEVDPVEAVVNPELLAAASGTLDRSWNDWAVTDADARSSLDVLRGADPEQQGLLIKSMRESGKISTLLENLSEEDLASLDGTLAAYLTSDRMGEALEGLIVTDEAAGGALDLLVALPPEQQAASAAEMSDATFSTFLGELPDGRRTELQTLFDATADPARKLQIWEVLHAGRTQQTHDAAMESSPAWYDRSDEASAVRHRNSQRDAIQSSTNDEIAQEAAFLRSKIESGTATIDDVNALDRRKSTELGLENQYGINLTNDPGSESLIMADRERRVWTETELAAMGGALERMPAAHLRDNQALTEVRREHIRRDGLLGNDTDAGVGADAGSGMIRFYDTGTDFNGTTNGPGTPWRTDSESDLSEHDASRSGAKGTTHLIQEVLSHEAGHTIHQGDDALWTDFQALSGWEDLGEDGVRQRMVASGMSEEDANAAIARLESTREGTHYTSQQQVRVNGKLIEVDPYSSDFVSVDEEAIAGRDEDPNGEWAYAETNAADHFAEIYTKAIHAPESLYNDLVTEPQAKVTGLETNLASSRSTLESLRSTLSPEEIKAMEDDIHLQETSLTNAQRAAQIRASQHAFFQDRVFGVDDTAIQGLVAPPGKEAVYETYKQEAAMCMTPAQLQALEQRYASRL